MWIVLFVVLMDIVGIGIVSPIFPFYVLRLGGEPDAATFCMALYTGAMFLSTPVLGRLSDRLGRKPVMAFSLLGSALGYLMLVLADSIWMIALSRIIGGAMAGNFGAAQAYISDRTGEQDRLRFMGYFGAAMGLGYVFGPVLGSWLGGSSFESANLAAPALAAMGLSLLGFLGVVCFVQESAPVKDHRATADRPAQPFFAWMALRGEHLTDAGRSGLLVGAVACSALYQLGSGFYENIFPIWAEHFGVVMGPRGMLPMFLASGASYVLVQAFVIGRLAGRNQERRWLVVAGLMLMVVTYAMTLAGDQSSALASTLLMAAIAACAGIIFTCANTLISLCAAPASRGLVLGMASSVGMLGKTLATGLSGVLFSQLGAHSPYYAAVIVAGALVLVAAMLRPAADEQREVEPG